MSSVEILPHDVDRDVWLAARREGVGASDVSGIMNMSRFNSARKVWRDKRGLTAPIEPTWAMIKGNLLEPGLRDWYTRQTGAIVDLAGLQRSTTEPIMQYSPDGFIGDEGLFEAKTASFRMRSEWEDDQVSDHAELQVQAGLWITGRKWADVAAAVSDDEPVIRRVWAHPELQTQIVEACRSFWTHYVEADIEPAPTWPDLDDIRDQFATSDPRTFFVGDATHDELCKTKQHASQVVKDYKKIEETAKATLMVAMGAADHLVINGEISATWKTTAAGSRSFLVPANRKPVTKETF